MLSNRLHILVSYLECISNGSIEKDSEILSLIQSVIVSFSCLKRETLFIQNQENVGLLTMCLATDTKRIAVLEDLISKWNLVNHPKGFTRKSKTNSSFRNS